MGGDAVERILERDDGGRTYLSEYERRLEG